VDCNMCTVAVSKKGSCRETSCLQCVLQSLGQIPIQSRRDLNGMQQFVVGKSFERVSLVCLKSHAGTDESLPRYLILSHADTVLS